MSRNSSKSYFVVSTAILSALAILFDVMSDVFPLRTPWGMKIDFVGIIGFSLFPVWFKRGSQCFNHNINIYQHGHANWLSWGNDEINCYTSHVRDSSSHFPVLWFEEEG